MKKIFTKKVVAPIAALLMTGAFATTTYANTDLTVQGGGLTGGTVSFNNFTKVVLDGTSETTSSVWTISNIIDARGTGEGWSLSLTVDQFKEHDGTNYVLGGKTLDMGSMVVTQAPVVSQVDTTSSAANTIMPVAQNKVLDGTTTKLLTAAVDGGMGSFSFSEMTTTLTLPAKAYAKTYRADAVVSLTSGPQ